jgi:hypothetical protein
MFLLPRSAVEARRMGREAGIRDILGNGDHWR